MSRSLWDSTTKQLLDRASSGDPTPGGGAVAAVAAAFGIGLVRMAIEVTVSGSEQGDPIRAGLTDAASRAADLQAILVEAADRDVAEFDALMAGYRMPRGTDEERATRSRAIAEATVAATEGPLRLADTAVLGIAVSAAVEPLVKDTIVSDVQAGRDLLRGAALAALRTADINLADLEGRTHPAAPQLRERRDQILRAVAEHEEER